MFDEFVEVIQCNQTNLVRRVRAYRPLETDLAEALIVYCTDGQTTKCFADELTRFDTMPRPIVLIGVDYHPSQRNGEYVIGRNPDLFARHETFFVESIRDWGIQRLGLGNHPKRKAVFGFSCGGCFAVSMALRHPDQFAGAIAMSVAGRPLTMDSNQDKGEIAELRFALAAGEREMSGMKSYMRRMSRWLRNRSAACRYQVVPGNHDLTLWTAEFVPALRWLFEI